MLATAETSSLGVQRSHDPRIVGYPLRLNLYLIPPPYEISIEEFEQDALDRLTVLKAIETAQLRNQYRAKTGEVNPHVLKVIKEHLPLGRNTLLKTNDYKTREQLLKQFFKERKKDHISHFILKLAFCQTSDLRRWFSKLETELFKLRLEQEPEEQEVLMQLADLGGSLFKLDSMKPTKPEEKALFATLVKEFKMLYNVNDEQVLKLAFYKVPFEKVADQVGSRNVIVKGGWAFVPQQLQSVLLVNAFRDLLIHTLESTAKALPRMDEDDRLVPILYSLSKQHLSAQNTSAFTGNSERGFSHLDIDKLAPVHFAPCMKNLHVQLRKSSHLRHFGRLQYGLFLKGIGLPYEEALTFWRKAFNRMTDDQFQKGYAYNIRHSYGLEGKRTNYAPYNCMKIITSNHPSAGDHHGCPFRHFSQDNLRPMLADYLTSSQASAANAQAGITEIMNLTKQNHYQLACTRLFELTRGQALKEQGGNAVMEGTSLIDTIEHPNQYFEYSFKGIDKLVKAKQPAAESAPVADTSQGHVDPQQEMIHELTRNMDFDDDPLSDFEADSSSMIVDK